jgi:hypothetical protein
MHPSSRRPSPPTEGIVYVPAGDDPAVTSIPAGAGIVGEPVGDGDVTIYFEVAGAVNTRTFAQRVRIAYERMTDRAQTTKARLVPRDALVPVGTYSPTRLEVSVTGPRSARRLGDWLGVAELDHELRVSA